MRIPDNEMLSDCEGIDFANMVSTMLVEGLIGNNYDFELGDSDEHVKLHPMVQGPEGLENMKADCRIVRQALEAAIPRMSDRYRRFWQLLAKDFDENGVSLPFYGKIL